MNGFAYPEEQLDQAAEIVRAAKQILVLTGAGISAESGIATFRDAGGLWEGHRPEEVATPQAFQRDPELVWRFYNARRKNLASVQPNPGHFALAQLQQRPGLAAFTLVTQNIDGLHQMAGSTGVLEIHGALRRVRCTRCDYIGDRGTEALDDLPICESCGHMLRPDVVWFGEMLPQHIWEQAEQAVVSCDCLFVVGTSAVVYPAAGLIHVARLKGAKVIEVNLRSTDASHLADVSLQGPSGKILPELLKRL